MKLIGIVKDQWTGGVWLFSDNMIWELDVIDEDRDVWWMYLERKQFDLALEYCRKHQRDIVINEHAHELIDKGLYTEAAMLYTSSSKPVEEVMLQLMDAHSYEGLIIYLKDKLDKYIEADNGGKKYITQRKMLSTWLVQVHLSLISEAISQDPKSKEFKGHFRKFLEEYCEHMDHATTYQLLASFGFVTELLQFAVMIQDFDRVISHFIDEGEYLEALEEIQDRSYSSPELWYKFGNILMQKLPKETVQILKESKVNPSKFLPALMRYDSSLNNVDDNVHHALDYLLYCVNELGNRDTQVHNYLISLLVRNSKDSEIVQFLQSQLLEECYDLKYALRLCNEEHKYKSCVLLYSRMGLFNDAIELALKLGDLELALEILHELPEDNDDLRNLWLIVAKYVAADAEDMSKAMDILKQCKYLNFEDILPLFPDKVQIADFKDEISSSLKHYSEVIDSLKDEMEVFTDTTDKLRRDIRQLRNRYADISARQACDICHRAVMEEMFYIFPCTHVFHIKCMEDHVRKHLKVHPDKVEYFPVSDDLELDSATVDAIAHMKALHSNLRKNPLNLAISECFLCGDVMIESIGMDLSDTLQAWRI